MTGWKAVVTRWSRGGHGGHVGYDGLEAGGHGGHVGYDGLESPPAHHAQTPAIHNSRPEADKSG